MVSEQVDVATYTMLIKAHGSKGRSRRLPIEPQPSGDSLFLCKMRLQCEIESKVQRVEGLKILKWG